MPFNKDINRFADKSNILYNMTSSSLLLLIDNVGNLYHILHYKSTNIISFVVYIIFQNVLICFKIELSIISVHK
jgi:hypothetical protein